MVQSKLLPTLMVIPVTQPIPPLVDRSLKVLQKVMLPVYSLVTQAITDKASQILIFTQRYAAVFSLMMNWPRIYTLMPANKNNKYNQMRQVHELVCNGTVLARIFVAEKPRLARPFRTRCLISAFYFGEKTLARLDRAKKEWVSNRRKFRERNELDEYLERRKGEVERFIRTREAELS